jgi:hypothetical protein
MSLEPQNVRFFFHFPDFFAIFAPIGSIGLKLGVLLCSQEFLFQCVFRIGGFIFARIMPLERSRISDFVFSFPDILFLPSL